MKTFLSYKLLILTAALVLSLSACDEYLSTNPDDRTNIELKEHLDKLLVSAYPVASAYQLCEMASDNTDKNFGTSWSAIDMVQTESFEWADSKHIYDDSPYKVWAEHYTAIATANEVIQVVEREGFPEDLNGVYAEALLCRAYGHFVLANVFCHAYNETTSNTDLGIPYMDVPEEHLFTEYERETVAKTFAKIEKDIEAALPLINQAVYSVPKYHFNVEAANAFAARFFLYYRKYDRAIECANRALGADPKTKVRDWYELKRYVGTDYDRGGTRFIATDQPANFLLIPAYSIWGRVHGPYAIGSLYSYNLTIARYEVTGSSTPWGSAPVYNHTNLMTGAAKVVVYKIKEFFEYVDPVAGIGYAHIVQPIFTGDETLLTRAEAYALRNQAGDLERAFDDLEVVGDAYYYYDRNSVNSIDQVLDHYRNMEFYTHVAPTPKKQFNTDRTFSEDQENMLHAILHMRRIVCIHEGLRWHDVKRYGMVIHRREVVETISKSLDVLTANDPRRAIQIPQVIIEAGVVPNPR